MLNPVSIHYRHCKRCVIINRVHFISYTHYIARASNNCRSKIKKERQDWSDWAAALLFHSFSVSWLVEAQSLQEILSRKSRLKCRILDRAVIHTASPGAWRSNDFWWIPEEGSSLAKFAIAQPLWWCGCCCCRWQSLNFAKIAAPLSKLKQNFQPCWSFHHILIANIMLQLSRMGLWNTYLSYLSTEFKLTTYGETIKY